MLDVIFVGNFPQSPLNHSREKEWPPSLKIIIAHPLGKLWMLPSYVGSFGEGIIQSAEEITASKDGRVMVLDSDQSCHLFNVDGLHLANFSVNIQGDRYYRIACHPVGEHVVVAGEERETHLLIVAIYTVNEDFERNFKP